MNEAMKQAWVEINQMLGETTPEELNVFLRTWQRAMQAEREACAKVCDDMAVDWQKYVTTPSGTIAACAAAIRARSNT